MHVYEGEFAMKIVLAEKVSPATLAVFQQEPTWTVVTGSSTPVIATVR